jgi:DNA-binding XRE family transcriptional regulator
MTDKNLRSDGFEWAYNEFIKNDPESFALFNEYEVQGEIAQQIYDLRNQAGLTQSQLARLVGIADSTITELEDADYEGDSLRMLVRIASALKKKLEIRFVSSASMDPPEVAL